MVAIALSIIQIVLNVVTIICIVKLERRNK